MVRVRVVLVLCVAGGAQLLSSRNVFDCERFLSRLRLLAAMSSSLDLAHAWLEAQAEPFGLPGVCPIGEAEKGQHSRTQQAELSSARVRAE